MQLIQVERLTCYDDSADGWVGCRVFSGSQIIKTRIMSKNVDLMRVSSGPYQTIYLEV